MSSKQNRPADTGAMAAAPGRAQPRAGTAEDAFDLWLHQSLGRAYDAALAEPVPEDLLRLIEEDRPERERLRLRRPAPGAG